MFSLYMPIIKVAGHEYVYQKSVLPSVCISALKSKPASSVLKKFFKWEISVIAQLFTLLEMMKCESK